MKKFITPGSFFTSTTLLTPKSVMTVMIAVCMSLSSVFAQTNTWTGATSSSWGTSTNWSLGLVPTAAHDVVINANASISINTSPVINKLTIGGTANVVFTSSGSARTITIDNTGSSIATGAKLTLAGSGFGIMGIAFSGNGQAMAINGTLLLRDISAGASYNASNSLTTVSGTIRNQTGDGGTVSTITSASNNLSFLSGGSYEHALNSGTIPSATWNAASNLVITGMTTVYPANTAQSFGNVTFNIATNTSLEMLTNLVCQGNLNISNTGSGVLRLTNASGSKLITVGGNFTHSAGNFAQTNSTASGTVTVAGNFIKSSTGTYTVASSANALSLTVGGDVSITAGTFTLSAGSGAGTLFVAGSYTHSGGTVNETSTGVGNIVFNGNGTAQNFGSGGTVFGLINYTVNSAAYLQMAAAATVASGNSFTLSANAILGIRSSAGVTTAGATGNVQTTNRTYTAGSSFIYNGTSAQNTGDGLTSTNKLNLTIDNNGNTVTGNNVAFNISGDLLVSKGNFLMSAGNADYSVGGSLTVASGATLTHNVSWDATNAKMIVGGNISIDGTYTKGAAPRAHINMIGAGKTIHTGSSSLNILTLNNPTGTIISADGKLTVDDNFWPSWTSGGTFNTNGKAITANSGMLVAGGVVNVDAGSSLLINSFMQIGYPGYNGNLNFNGGSIQVNGGITIEAAGNITNANLNNTLSLTGDFSNNGIFNPGLATLQFNGVVKQSVYLSKPTLFYNIIAANSVAITATSDTLKLMGMLSFGNVNNASFGTGNKFTLLSTATYTASVGDYTNAGVNSGNLVSGKVNVERYISNGAKWRLLSVPTDGTQTFKQGWQESAAAANGNPAPGYGTIIGDNHSATYIANGFDTYTPGGPTVKAYNATTNMYVGIASTNVAMKSAYAYMTYIRSNRSGALSATTLRTTGDLYGGTQPAINVAASQFAAIGNPYASAIDLTKLTITGLQDVVYVWDPKLGGTYGLGAYQTLIKMGADYMVFPGGGSYGAQLSVVNTVESGQGFFVKALSTGGSIQFVERAKTAGGSRLVSRTPAPESPMLRSTLYAVATDTTTLIDAAMVNFENGFSDGVDEDDISKVANGSENVSVKVNNTLLTASRRSEIAATDTIRLNLTGLRVQDYKWSISMDHMNLAGRSAFLNDAYTGTQTALDVDGTTDYHFTVLNIAGSYAANRFSIVFNQAGGQVLPVTISSVSAMRNSSRTNEVNVSWSVENEISLKQYEVEHSTDGIHFTAIKILNATAGNSGRAAYSQLHTEAVAADNFYRVKAVSISGLVQYSPIVKVAALKTSSNSSISVYPNPVTDNNMNLHFANGQKGMYSLQLVNAAGQVTMKSNLQVNETNAAKVVLLPGQTAKGSYQLQIGQPDGSNTTISVLVK